ncbi:MAG: hypothetical protein R3B59_06235 [Dehalococcoidia bacterium]
MRGRHLLWPSMSALCGLAALASACGAIEDEQPTRNPLAATPAATGIPTEPTTSSPSGTASPAAGPASPAATHVDGTPASGAAAELAAGRAIEAMAGWLGVAQRELTPRLVEAVEWPDACLGVRQPLLCAQVVTPGYRVRLEDALGATHTVHLDARSPHAAWAGEVVEDVTVTGMDVSARRATVQTSGNTLTLRLAPGTTWFPEDGERQAVGKRARVAYDPAAAPGTPGTAVWVALEGS